MCWSPEASTALAVTGTAAAVFAWIKRQPMAIVIPLVYFTAMEALQAVQYTVVDLCGLPMNEILTLVGYVHIAFQPFFINMLAMHFLPEYIRKKISKYVYILCGFAAVSMLIQLFPADWAGQCVQGSMLCAETLCTVSGSWHIAWDVPLNGMYNMLFDMFYMSMPGYVLVGLVLPFIYGSWKFNTYQIFFGLIVAELISGSSNEAAAVWCLLSIGLIILVVGPKPLRKYFYIKKWGLWKYLDK